MSKAKPATPETPAAPEVKELPAVVEVKHKNGGNYKVTRDYYLKYQDRLELV